MLKVLNGAFSAPGSTELLLLLWAWNETDMDAVIIKSQFLQLGHILISTYVLVYRLIDWTESKQWIVGTSRFYEHTHKKRN